MQTQGSAGTSQEPHLFDWQLRVQWVLKSLDEVPEDAEQKVLPVAKQFLEIHRARVMLPSGKVLVVAGSVLLDYCHALRQHGAELLDKVLCLSFLPAADNLWNGDHVEMFFSDLHLHRLDPKHFDNEFMMICYGALIYALGVEDLVEEYKKDARDMLVKGENYTADCSLFAWLGGYQLLNPDWKAEALVALTQLSPKGIKRWLTRYNKRRMLEAFTAEEIATLVYSRWRGMYAQLPVRPSAVSTKRPRPQGLGVIVLDRSKHLPPSMQLKIVISDDFSIVCDRTVATIRVPFIRESPIDESKFVPTMHLPFASSFPQDEVLEFFTRMNDGAKFTTLSSWKLSWVQLADHLQMSEELDAAAEWVWDTDRLDTLLEWLPVTRLHSMQQRRPVDMFNTLTPQDVLGLLVTAPEEQGLVKVFERYGLQFVEQVGSDALLELLSRPGQSGPA